jgi:hypothetical protein
MKNTCWDCKHNTLKLKVLVPHDQTIREHVQQTGKMQSDIVAIVKEKHDQYTVWYRLGDTIKQTTIKMLHVCKLHIDPQTHSPCGCHAQKVGANKICNIIYSKTPRPAEAELIH